MKCINWNAQYKKSETFIEKTISRTNVTWSCSANDIFVALIRLVHV